MRRLKRSTALLQRSRNCLRGRKASRNERDYARRKSRELARSLQTSMLEDSALYSTWGDAQILFPAVIAAAFGQYWARS